MNSEDEWYLNPADARKIARDWGGFAWGHTTRLVPLSSFSLDKNGMFWHLLHLTNPKQPGSGEQEANSRIPAHISLCKDHVCGLCLCLLTSTVFYKVLCTANESICSLLLCISPLQYLYWGKNSSGQAGRLELLLESLKTLFHYLLMKWFTTHCFSLRKQYSFQIQVWHLVLNLLVGYSKTRCR